jgi:hypothetical protein
MKPQHAQQPYYTLFMTITRMSYAVDMTPRLVLAASSILRIKYFACTWSQPSNWRTLNLTSITRRCHWVSNFWVGEWFAVRAQVHMVVRHSALWTLPSFDLFIANRRHRRSSGGTYGVALGEHWSSCESLNCSRLTPIISKLFQGSITFYLSVFYSSTVFRLHGAGRCIYAFLLCSRASFYVSASPYGITVESSPSLGSIWLQLKHASCSSVPQLPQDRYVPELPHFPPGSYKFHMDNVGSSTARSRRSLHRQKCASWDSVFHVWFSPHSSFHRECFLLTYFEDWCVSCTMGCFG